MAGTTISVGELRKNFDEYLRRVKAGEVIVITRYGKPVAEFMPAQAMQKEQESQRSSAKRT
jgi:prevent-host-death family protein